MLQLSLPPFLCFCDWWFAPVDYRPFISIPLAPSSSWARQQNNTPCLLCAHLQRCSAATSLEGVAEWQGLKEWRNLGVDKRRHWGDKGPEPQVCRCPGECWGAPRKGGSQLPLSIHFGYVAPGAWLGLGAPSRPGFACCNRKAGAFHGRPPGQDSTLTPRMEGLPWRGDACGERNSRRHAEQASAPRAPESSPVPSPLCPPPSVPLDSAAVLPQLVPPRMVPSPKQSPLPLNVYM